MRDIENTTNWRSAFFHRPAPYLTDAGFTNPPCSRRDEAPHINAHFRGGTGVSRDSPSLVRHNHTTAGTYVIGENDDCMEENNTDNFCNGPLKPNTVYVWVHRRDSESCSSLKTIAFYVESAPLFYFDRFKFRATNINGQYTDSEYSEHVRTAGMPTGNDPAWLNNQTIGYYKLYSISHLHLCIYRFI